MGYVIEFDLLQMYTKVFVSFCNNFFAFKAMQFFPSKKLQRKRKGFYPIYVGFDFTYTPFLARLFTYGNY
jgi:hypothetical protein